MANMVGEKGQVVIEKPLRDALGVQPGFVTVQTLIEDHVEIRFYPPEHNRSLRGALKATRLLSTDELRDAREQAWEEAVMEDWNREGEEG
jgi:bifunctional DNA-binding transcriptional regulator/antitoxin component of YhaV-PrlF toxin-antitoxin module